MLQQPKAVVIGIGELGSVFARGLLKTGVVVHPVTRAQPIRETLAVAGPVDLILVAVGEEQLFGVLADIPEDRRHRVALVQNELVPRDWQTLGYTDVSGVVVWFEKKRGRDVHIVLPSLAYGPKAKFLNESLSSLDIPNELLELDRLDHELALKNLYILVHNIAGMRFSETVSDLWRNHQGLMRALAEDILCHQEARLEHTLDRVRLLDELSKAVAADPGHGSAGRTAPMRLARVRRQAHEFGLVLDTLKLIDPE